jgi:hypothetical protein
MATREQQRRLQGLEQRTARATHKTALVLRLTCEPTPEQQAAIAEAKRTHRPILLVRGKPLEIDPELRQVVEAGELCGSGSPKPDMGPLMRSSRWD